MAKLIETTKLVAMTEEYITFSVPSSRGGNHEVVFNRKTQEWSCTCEDYWYRKRNCKHTRMAKEFLQDLYLEVFAGNETYVGETITLNPTVKVGL